MKTLTEVYEKLAAVDKPLQEKHAQEQAVLHKQAEEEDAAGRIMARGFADELHKLAGLDSQMLFGKPRHPKPGAAHAEHGKEGAGVPGHHPPKRNEKKEQPHAGVTQHHGHKPKETGGPASLDD